MLFWHDTRWCYRFNMVLIWKGVEALKYTFAEGDIWLGFETVGRMMHMSPVIYEECLRQYEDLKYLERDFALLNSYGGTDLGIHLFEDVLFNLGDIIRNARSARESLEKGDFNLYGMDIGQIIADVMLISPLDFGVWTLENSQIVQNGEKADKIDSMFYSTSHLDVQASQPTTLS